MADTDNKKQKQKRPTAEKRMIQNKKLQLQHKMVKSKIRTACRRLTENVKSNKKESFTEDLKAVYSLVDKAVKRNIFKPNKAKRMKAHYAKSIQQAATV